MQAEAELMRLVRQIRPGLIGATSNPNINLLQLIDELKRSPHLAILIQSRLEEMLLSRDYTLALTEMGLTLESGVFTEIFKRIEYKFLPKATDDSDVLALLGLLFDSPSDGAWFEKLNRDKLLEFLQLILPDKERFLEALQPQIHLSLEILSVRLAGLGYDPIVSGRLRERPEYLSAFLDVTRKVNQLILGSNEDKIQEVRDQLGKCTQAVRWIRSRRNVDGASLALTFRLLRAQQVIQRMQMLLEVVESMHGEWNPRPALALFREIALAQMRRFDISEFLKQNMELLAYQITEHTGRAGEHYITRNRSEWNTMFRSAAIGGVIVAALALVKVLISKVGMPPLPEAFFYGLWYALGFVFIHFVHGTLATKQPAMTASTLANSMDEAKNSLEALDNLSEVIIRTIRSQMVALFGNFALALVLSVIVGLGLELMNIPLMKDEKAQVMLKSLHPWKSLSLWYAAVAGVCLFVSGLLAGAADNWFIFNHVGRRLEVSKILSKLVGPQNLYRSIKVIDQNLGFLVGNISLGFLLGSMASIGQITGLPLDIRHITFASANLGLSLSTLEFQVPFLTVFWTVISVVMMGFINLIVSFSLSLFVAVRSRGIRFSQTSQLVRLLYLRFKTSPWDFFRPPGEKVA